MLGQTQGTRENKTQITDFLDLCIRFDVMRAYADQVFQIVNKNATS